MAMEVKTEKIENSTALISAEGRIDTNTSPEFEEKINAVLADCDKLIIDFAKVEYISSSGLRVLLSAQKAINKKNGNMAIRNVSKEIMEIFEVTGFDTILTIE